MCVCFTLFLDIVVSNGVKFKLYIYIYVCVCVFYIISRYCCVEWCRRRYASGLRLIECLQHQNSALPTLCVETTWQGVLYEIGLMINALW